MNNRVKIILGIIIFIIFLVVADKVLKLKNSGNSNMNIENSTYNSTSNVIEVTQDSFENEVIKSDKKVLIDFYATWCGPCKILSPVVEEVSNERDDVKFVKIDVDNAEQIANDYSIYQIPTLVIVDNGKEVSRITGVINKEQLNQFIKEH